jgi:serine/threonine protein kinase
MPKKEVRPTLPQELAGAYALSDLPCLGSGSFGTVFAATRIDDSTPVAVKIIDCADRNRARLAARELSVLRDLSHPNIVRQLACHTTTSRAGSSASQAFVVLELVEGETLLERVRACGCMDEREARSIFRQIIAAMQYLHANGIIHRDLSTNNVMLCGERPPPTPPSADTDTSSSSHGAVSTSIPASRGIPIAKPPPPPRVVLIDFGFAREIGGVLDLSDGGLSPKERRVLDLSACGTRPFAAPELLQGVREAPRGGGFHAPVVSRFGMMADVYALGCVLRHMLTGAPPDRRVASYFALHNGCSARARARLATLTCCAGRGAAREALPRGDGPLRPMRKEKELSDAARSFIAALTHRNPLQRISLARVDAHEWLCQRAPGSDNQEGYSTPSKPRRNLTPSFDDLPPPRRNLKPSRNGLPPLPDEAMEEAIDLQLPGSENNAC